MRVGDLTGTGKADIVLVRCDEGFDERYFPHSVVYAAAYSTDGTLLWTVGDEKSASKTRPNTDVPAQIYDIDNDGNNEFICVMADEFCIFDSSTGVLKKKYPLPDENAHDAIAFADVEGKGYPQNVILKNRYNQLWVMDVNFNVMWTYKGNIGHYVLPCDINGDGKDEIVAGGTVLNGDGEVMWQIDAKPHVDGIWVGRLSGDKNALPDVVFTSDKVSAYSAEGEFLWDLDSEFIPNSITFGCFGVNDCVAKVCGVKAQTMQALVVSNMKDTERTLFAEDKIFTENTKIRTIHGAMYPNVDGILIKNESKVQVLSSMGEELLSIPTDGDVLCADILGNGYSAVLIYTDANVDIYMPRHSDKKTALTYSRPQKKEVYNTTVYNVTEQDMSQFALGIITGNYMETSPFNWALQCKRCEVEDCNEIITRADFAVLLAAALNLKDYERGNFSDVYRNDYYYSATAVLKQYTILEDTLGRFSPKSALTGEEAQNIIKRAGIELPSEIPSGELTKMQVGEIILEILSVVQ